MKKGFTLAEVLITLTIIGVIAALTIPNLMRKHYSHATYVKLNKNYTILKNAYELIEKEYGNFSDWNRTNIHVQLWERFGEHLKYIKKCEKTNVCNPSPAVTKLNSNEQTAIVDNNAYGYYLADGTSILFATTSETSMANYGIPYCYNKSAGIIYVDLNGTKKGPNKMGRDVFVFLVYPCGDGLIPTFVPAGVYEDRYLHKASINCAPDDSELGSGITCANKVLSERGVNY